MHSNNLTNYLSHTFDIKADNIDSNVTDLFTFQKFEKGDFFSKTEQACQKLAFIHNGLIRIYANLDGKEVTQWISTKGYFVTDLQSFFFQKPSIWNIQCLTDCELYTITHDKYTKLAEVFPQWPQIEKTFILKCFSIIEQRIFTHLSMTAQERYETFFAQNKELFHQVPMQYLASILGMTPETFSRIRNKLAN